MSNIVNILRKNVLPLDGTIALIVRKSVHTPENSIVIILPKKRLPHMHTWLSTVIIYVLKKERSIYVLDEPKPDVKHML